jgi:hypothetical protein
MVTKGAQLVDEPAAAAMTMADEYRQKPMRIQARKGSEAERLYYTQSALPGAPFPLPAVPQAIAPGITADPLEDLIFHGGKTVPKMQFQNVYLGTKANWAESDVKSIDSGITRAMRFNRLNNVMTQYFPGTGITCDTRASFLQNRAAPNQFTQDLLKQLMQDLFNQGLLKAQDLDATIFNLILPPGGILSLDNADSRQGLGGFHDSLHFDSGGKRVTLYYSANVFSQVVNGVENGIAVFDQPWKNVVATLYHELNEFRTDPDVGDAIEQRSNDFLGWTSRKGREVGDQPIFVASDLHQVFKEISGHDGGPKLSVQFLFSNAVHGAEGPITHAHSPASTPSGGGGAAHGGKKVAVRPHGNRLRGAELSRGSVLFGGPFGRMFRAVPPAEFGNDDATTQQALAALAAKMTADFDPPKDGPDAEESGLPSAYTYLGQFIDHDLTFDPASSLQRQNDPDALVDYRTPRFDLDNVYGRGPDDNPYLYEDGRLFILGQALTGAARNLDARDLARSNPRSGGSRRAIIGDPRNDENVIISQLQGLFHRFHNKIATDHPEWDFSRVQREVRFHYQWLVLNDFLPAIVSDGVLNRVLPHVRKRTSVADDRPALDFYHARDEAFIPLEFSAAAYRFGHSMVRPGYRLSENIGPLAIFATNPFEALTGFREFPGNWAIDWGLFIDLEPRDPDDATRTQLAYRIDTSLVSPLGKLPPEIAINPSVLAERNLLRGWRMRLPSGQAIARAMGISPLADDKLLIGKFTGDPADIVGTVASIAPAFADNCPLWTYALAETEEASVELMTTKGPKGLKTRKLGPVGGRIVAETFVGLLLKDSTSFLAQDPRWTPSLGINGTFGLRDLIRVALEG